MEGSSGVVAASPVVITALSNVFFQSVKSLGNWENEMHGAYQFE